VVLRPVRLRDRDWAAGETLCLSAEEARHLRGNPRIQIKPQTPEPPPPPPPDMKPVTTLPRIAVVLARDCAISGRGYAAGELVRVTLDELRGLDCAHKLVMTDEIVRVLAEGRRKDPESPGTVQSRGL